MLSCSGRRAFTAALVVLLLTGLFAGGAKRADAGSDSAAYFMGGMMAGHVLSNIAAQKKAQTEAMQSMAYGGGGGFGRPYGQPEGYVRPQQPAPPPAPPQPTPQQQLNQLDALAAGGYITPAEYKARRQAILNAM